ncbi:RHS repeat-associated core domain-containing protein [Phenylobacterium sp. LjRoot164]
MHYNHFRSYDSKSGRYTQADPIGLHGGFNRFAYVGGSPLSEIDPRGLDNPGMGPYSPNDPPSDAFLCSGVLETYPHMWLCAGGSCSGYMVIFTGAQPHSISWRR